MLGHPATKVRFATLAETIDDAVSGERNPLDAWNVSPLGTRIKRVTTAAGAERTYTLQGWRVRFGDIDGVTLSDRFYLISGGAGGARTLLNGAGESIAHADSCTGARTLSHEFREWIAGIVAEDAPEDDRGAHVATRNALSSAAAAE